MVDVYGYSIATIPIICTIVYAVVEFLKYFFFSNSEKFMKNIPLLAAILGGVISLVVFFVAPELIPCASWYSSILMGCASGLSAVGINQIKKQAEKKDEKDADTR